MNTPNKLTLLRILMIPLFVAALLIPAVPWRFLVAAILFAAASFTDLLDGYLARRDNLVTDFGKFMDPLADKLLVTSAIVCFLELGFTSALVVIIILSRDLLVTSLRLVAAGSGKVIAADIWGKFKTASQMVSIVVILLMQELSIQGIIPASVNVTAIGNILLYITAALTVLSGINYLWKNRSFISQAK